MRQEPSAAPQLSDEALEEINRLWTVARLFFNVAHEINNALQVISGSAELLGASADLNPVLLRRAQTIGGQASLAAVAIDRLLKYTRSTHSPPRRLDLAVLVDTAVAMIKRTRVGISTDRSDEEPYWIIAEEGRALQLLINLLLSLETLPANGHSAEIAVRLDRQPPFVLLTIGGKAATAAESPAEGSIPPPKVTGASDVAPGAQLWAASRLAPTQSAILTVDRKEADTMVMSLALREASPS